VPPDAPSLALSNLRNEYERRRDLATEKAALEDGRSALIGNGRVFLVLAWAVVAYRGWDAQDWRIHAVFALTTLASLVVQQAIDDSVARHRRRAAFHARNLDRLDGKWREFESTGAALVPPNHPYALDLDVVGQGSLFQLVDTTRTRQGERTLARWLLERALLEPLRERLDSVKSLAASLDDRESLATPEAAEAGRVNEEGIASWGAGPAVLVVPTWLRLASFVLPPITGTFLGIVLLGLAKSWTPLWVSLGLLAVHAAIIRSTSAQVKALATFSERAERDLLRLLPMFEAATSLRAPGSRLDALRAELSGTVEGIRALRRRVTFFQSRANFIVAIASPVLFWDLHAAMLLQAWHDRSGRRLAALFAALGELEALAAFGTYASEHPDDAWPELADADAPLHSVALGHPLIDASKCVRNDVEVGGPGTMLLVTGSNMSGKSTLLRAVGLNVILGQAGLPVRARSMRLPMRQVATVMRAVDSLQEGASLFLAEVRRLKSVVDVAERTPTLFLLDEILHGTNTRERSIGARGVISRLLERGATGLVSTHDLTLVALGDELGARVAFSHFTDQVDGADMTFDYVMRPGVVQTSNALRVLRANGLDVEVPPDDEPVK